MKRVVVAMGILLIVLLMACVSTAEQTAEEGAITSYEVKNESYLVKEEMGLKYVSIFAEVTNTGTTNISLNDTVALVMDAENNMITTITMMEMYPKVLDAGDTGYIYANKMIDKNKEVGSIQLNVSFQPSTFYKIFKYPVESVAFTKEKDPFGVKVYLDATIKNEDENALFDPTILYVITEKETGKICYINEKVLYSGVGILPDSRVIIRNEIFGAGDIDEEKYEVKAQAYIVAMIIE